MVFLATKSFRPKNPENILLLLAFFLGSVVGIARAHSYALFLQNIDAVWTSLAVLFSELLYLPIARTNANKKKLATFVSAIGLLLAFLFTLNVFNPETMSQTVVFFVITVIFRNFARWVLFEISMLFLPKSRSSQAGFANSAAVELGSICAVTAGLFVTLGPLSMLFWVGVLWALIFTFIGFYYNNPLAIAHSTLQTARAQEPHELAAKKSVGEIYIVVTFLAGLFYSLQEFLWRYSLQSSSLEKSQIHDFSFYYVLGSNALGMVTAFFASRQTRLKRISPEKIMLLFWLISSVGILIFSLNSGGWGSVILGILTSAAFRSLFVSANNNLVSCFDDDARNEFRRTHQITMYILPLIPVFIISYGLSQALNESFDLAIVLTLMAIVLSSIYVMRVYLDRLTKLMFISLHSLDRHRKINGALLLSYLRPKGYDKWYQEILEAKPKTLLIKTIIESLSYYPTKRSVKIITSLYDNPKEEIKFAVCDAIDRIDIIQSVAFLMKVILSPEESLRIRRHCVHLLTRRSGKFLAGVLSNRLEMTKAADLRKVILQGLSEINDPNLFVTFLKYVDDPVDDIFIFILIGLYKSSKNRSVFDRKISQMISLDDDFSFGAACYTLAYLNDSRWLDTVKVTQARNPKQVLYKIWYLYKMEKSLSPKYIVAFKRLYKNSELRPLILDVFVSLEISERIKILNLMLQNLDFFEISFESIVNQLKDSNLDFHMEILFLTNLKRKQTTSLKIAA